MGVSVGYIKIQNGNFLGIESSYSEFRLILGIGYSRGSIDYYAIVQKERLEECLVDVSIEVARASKVVQELSASKNIDYEDALELYLDTREGF